LLLLHSQVLHIHEIAPHHPKTSEEILANSYMCVYVHCMGDDSIRFDSNDCSRRVGTPSMNRSCIQLLSRVFRVRVI
jgi:hypothetical protein